MKRITSLDGLRGLAALSVLIYHGLYWYTGKQYISAGRLAVFLFFSLSAYTMHKVYHQHFKTALTLISLKSFYINRVARIIPLLALISFMQLIYELLVNKSFIASIAQFILTATGAFSLSAPGSIASAVGAWSLGIEIFFYLIFPVLCIYANSLSLKRLIIVASLITILQLISTILTFEVYSYTNYWSHYILPLTFSGYFAWGFVGARINFKSEKLGLLALTIIMFIIWMSSLVPVHWYAILSWPGALFLPPIFGLLIAIISSWEPANILSVFFRYIGDLSYSLYLVHPLIYFTLTRLFWLEKEPTPFIFMTLFITLSYLASYIIYSMFEVPARKLIRKYK